MSDNLRRYRAIREALIQCYPDEPSDDGSIPTAGHCRYYQPDPQLLIVLKTDTMQAIGLLYMGLSDFSDSAFLRKPALKAA